MDIGAIERIVRREIPAPAPLFESQPAREPTPGMKRRIVGRGWTAERSSRRMKLSISGMHGPIEVYGTWYETARQRRQEFALALRIALKERRRQRKAAKGVFGWCTLLWDEGRKRLRSPIRRTIWHTDLLQAEEWSTSDVIEEAAGVHALHVPTGPWKHLPWPSEVMPRFPGPAVTGIVELGGQVVVGGKGCRAQYARIRELATDDPEIAVHLMVAYPGVKVHLTGRSQ